ncbi:MAG: hypothetical protein FWG90_00825 [Oscillospiraceae bacterium]|nr:hypothetical protein [Oscillospiraceae bacterium]
MEELFVATEQGNIPIEPRIAEKYNLKKGVKTPFSNHTIVDKNGNATPEPPKKEPVEEPEDEGIILTTAEVLDFAAGADSYTT